MTAKAGKDFLLQSDDGAGNYTTFGGLRSSSMSLNNEAIDVTNHGSAEWKELLDGAGIKNVGLSGSGIFTNAANEQLARTRCLNGTLANYRITDGIGTFTAKFKITKLERAGDYKGEQTWSMSFESSGAVTIA